MHANDHGSSELARPTPHTLRKFAAVLAGALVFLGIASLIKPDPRAATARNVTAPTNAHRTLPAVSGHGVQRLGPASTTESDVARRLGQIQHPSGWRLIGQLESREHHVLMFASPQGPRYSVYSLAGDLQMPDMAADEVYRLFPALDLTTLRDLPREDGRAIMLAEPRD